MLDFGIVDPHLHVWDTKRLRYPWLDTIPKLNRSFCLNDYTQACGAVAVDRMVFVQCECEASQYRDEVAWVSELAKRDARIKGIVAWAPLEKGDAVLEELEALASNPLVKGIRRIIQFEPDLEFCLRPSFIKGVALLKKFNFTFDICIACIHNANTIKFISQCPDIPMVLDHIGKPNIKDQQLDPWRKQIKELSKFRNVYCKVSSLATEADHARWTKEDLRPFVDHIFECFGFDRTMFAGDWPVSSLAADYPTCVETLCALIKGCSPDELYKLFHANARRFYHV